MILKRWFPRWKVMTNYMHGPGVSAEGAFSPEVMWEELGESADSSKIAC